MLRVKIQVLRKHSGYILTAFLPCAENGEIAKELVSPKEKFFNDFLVPKWGDLLGRDLRMNSIYVEGENPERFIEREVSRLRDIRDFNKMRAEVCSTHTFEL